MKTARVLIPLLVLGLSAASAALASGGPLPGFDVNKPAWLHGFMVQTYARIPRPGSGVAPSPVRRDDIAYLVGNIFDPTPFAADVIIPLPPGAPVPFLTVPAHDDVFARFASCSSPVDAFGRWVVAGTNGLTEDPDQNVKVRPMPENSLAGAPLAYAIKLNGRWRFLTNSHVIEQGVNAGLLAAIPAGPGDGFGGIGCLNLGPKY